MRARRRCVEIDTSKGLPAKKEEGLRIRSESFLLCLKMVSALNTLPVLNGTVEVRKVNSGAAKIEHSRRQD